MFIQNENHENYEIFRVPLQNHKSYKKLVTPCQNHENHEIPKISRQSYEIIEN